MLPKTAQKERLNTSNEINARIDKQIRERVRNYETSDKDKISKRLDELSKEWDTERVLETNASIFLLAGLLLGVTQNKKWFILSGIVGGFLLQHALQVWCPPLAIIRRLGVRSSSEIYKEKAMLEYLRGDFDSLSKSKDNNCNV